MIIRTAGLFDLGNKTDFLLLKSYAAKVISLYILQYHLFDKNAGFFICFISDELKEIL